jgi:hypothetical protein
VTNVLIVGWSRNAEACIESINCEVSLRFGQLGYWPLDPESVGGAKCFELDTWTAAFNYVPTKDILDIFATAPWDDPESMQILICEQDQSIFETICTAAALRAKAKEVKR